MLSKIHSDTSRVTFVILETDIIILSNTPCFQNFAEVCVMLSLYGHNVRHCQIKKKRPTTIVKRSEGWSIFTNKICAKLQDYSKSTQTALGYMGQLDYNL